MLRPLLVLLVAALVGLTAAPSYAAQWADTDPVGDANGWRIDLADPLCTPPTPVDAAQRGNVDISGLSVRHTRRVVRVAVSFADLDPALEQFVEIHLGTESFAWSLDVFRNANERGVFRTHVFLGYEPEWPTAEELAEMEAAGECAFAVGSAGSPCRIQRVVDTDLDVVRVVVPRRCLGTPHRVRVGVGTSDFEAPADPAETWLIGFNDVWGTTDPATPFIPQYGPWVPTP